MDLLSRQRRKPRLRIVGDHSRFHAGCRAVTHTLRRLALDKGWRLVPEHADYDALVVNGEGSMHDGSEPFHRKMQALAIAVHRKKPAYLVNTVWQDNPHDYDDVLHQLSGTFVREVLSQRELQERHGVQAVVVPDASYFAKLPRWSMAYNFDGKPAVTDFLLESKRDNGRCNVFGRMDHLFEDSGSLPFVQWSWGKIIASLRTSSYLITGRHHGVYAACVARIPFVASEGNTHKIEGLVRSAGANIHVALHPSGIPKIMKANLECSTEFERIYDWLDSQDIGAIMPTPSEALDQS